MSGGWTRRGVFAYSPPSCCATVSDLGALLCHSTAKPPHGEANGDSRGSELLEVRQVRAQKRVPRWVRMLVWMGVVAALVPPLIIFRARAVTTPEPRLHPIPDMDSQVSFKAQEENLAFADHRAMRLPVKGTVARGESFGDDHLYRGKIGEKWATGLPSGLVVDDEFMLRGRVRYEIYCAPCHGLNGEGNGPVAVRVASDPDLATNWTRPTNLVGSAGDEAPRKQPLGKIFSTITNGNRTMPPYRSQIPVSDRWAIVGYLRALQRSQVSQAGDVPVEIAERLNREPRLVIPYDHSEKN